MKTVVYSLFVVSNVMHICPRVKYSISNWKINISEFMNVIFLFSILPTRVFVFEQNVIVGAFQTRKCSYEILLVYCTVIQSALEVRPRPDPWFRLWLLLSVLIQCSAWLFQRFYFLRPFSL